jgi:hypothetical protein
MLRPIPIKRRRITPHHWFLDWSQCEDYRCFVCTPIREPTMHLKVICERVFQRTEQHTFPKRYGYRDSRDAGAYLSCVLCGCAFYFLKKFLPRRLWASACWVTDLGMSTSNGKGGEESSKDIRKLHLPL